MSFWNSSAIGMWCFLFSKHVKFCLILECCIELKLVGTDYNFQEFLFQHFAVVSFLFFLFAIHIAFVALTWSVFGFAMSFWNSGVIEMWCFLFFKWFVWLRDRLYLLVFASFDNVKFPHRFYNLNVPDCLVGFKVDLVLFEIRCITFFSWNPLLFVYIYIYLFFSCRI